VLTTVTVMGVSTQPSYGVVRKFERRMLLVVGGGCLILKEPIKSSRFQLCSFAYCLRAMIGELHYG
jgi:hypothetical protein